MQLTCIVGNGLDIGLGMKTRFTDFIDLHYLKLERDPNSVLGRFQALLRADKDRAERERVWREWADAEREFGQLDVPMLDPQRPFEDFEMCLTDFKKEFNVFLKKQNDAIRIPPERELELYTKFCLSVLNLGTLLRRKYSRRFYEVLPANQSVGINIITFNYTDVLDRLLKSRSKFSESSMLVGDLKNGQKRNYRIRRIHHVHGVLASDMVFGVDDLDQIKNEKVRQGCAAHKYFVKKTIDDVLGNENEPVASQLIAESGCLITLGLSFGVTDKSWWNILFKRVFSDKTLLVPCVYQEKEGVPPLPEQTKLYEDAYRQMFKTIDPQLRDGQIQANMTQCMNLVLPAHSLDPDGKDVWCDPLNLKWLGEKIGIPAAMTQMWGNDVTSTQMDDN